MRRWSRTSVRAAAQTDRRDARTWRTLVARIRVGGPGRCEEPKELQTVAPLAVRSGSDRSGPFSYRITDLHPGGHCLKILKKRVRAPLHISRLSWVAPILTPA